MTGVSRKTRDWATVLGAGSLAAIVAMLFGWCFFHLFLQDATPEEHRDTALAGFVRALGFLGFVLGTSFAAIRGAGISHALLGVMLLLFVVVLLGARGLLDVGEVLLPLAVGASGLVLAGAAGVLVRRVAERSEGASQQARCDGDA